MFKKGDLVRMIGDEDKELFIIVKINAPVVSSYSLNGRAHYRKDRTKMIIKSVDNPRFPGEFVDEKSVCEHFMTKKEVKPYSFLN